MAQGKIMAAALARDEAQARLRRLTAGVAVASVAGVVVVGATVHAATTAASSSTTASSGSGLAANSNTGGTTGSAPANGFGGGDDGGGFGGGDGNSNAQPVAPLQQPVAPPAPSQGIGGFSGRSSGS